MQLKEIKIYELDKSLIATEMTKKEVETLLEAYKKKFGDWHPAAFQAYVNRTKAGKTFRFIYFQTTF